MLIAWGLLGWSNQRTGLEFYRYDERIIPRSGSEWGDLLVQEDDFKDCEGRPVVVVVLDRKSTTDDLILATTKIKAVLDRGEQP